MCARKVDNRLTQWGALAAGLAHEIKNPLSTMNISLQLLHEDLLGRPQVSSAKLLPRVDLLISEVERLQRIVHDFLTLAKEPDLELKERDPNTLIEEIAAFVNPELAEQGVDLVTHLDRTVPRIHMDADLLRQALLNIIRNALQSMRDGGTVTIQTEHRSPFFELDVIDTGIGIPPEILDRIFDGFFSTKPEGTGIGLALTRQIIELHGGRVLCESAVGQGSKFTIRLPLAASRQEKAP